MSVSEAPAEPDWDKLGLATNKECEAMLKGFDEDSEKIRMPVRSFSLHSKFRAAPPDEVVVYSGHVDKINKRGVRQQRILLLTNRAIYNLGKPGQCKRRIKLEDVGSLTISDTSSQLVCHVPNEYDYHYESEDAKAIVKLLKEAYRDVAKELGNMPLVLPVVTTNDKDLDPLVNKKADARKSGISETVSGVSETASLEKRSSGKLSKTPKRKMPSRLPPAAPSQETEKKEESPPSGGQPTDEAGDVENAGDNGKAESVKPVPPASEAADAATEDSEKPADAATNT